MNDAQREAIKRRLAEMIESAGPDGIGFRELYAQLQREHIATRRTVQDQLFKLSSEGVIGTSGLVGNVCVYRHACYRQDMSEKQKDRAAIHAWQPLKTVFAGRRPSRFDVR